MRALTEREQADVALAAIASTEKEIDIIGEKYSAIYLKLLDDIKTDPANKNLIENLAVNDALVDILATLATLKFN